LLCLLALLVGASITRASEPPIKVILDTDGDADYDDVVGLMVAAVSPEVQIQGVVVTGQDVERRARAVTKALAIVGRDDVGVYLGEPPLSPASAFAYMAQFPRRLHGEQPELEKWAAEVTLAPAPMRGVDFYLDQVRRFPDQVSVIATGPLSTLGRAMQMADAQGTGAPFRQGIHQVLFSGGDFGTVEYNVYSDLEAARLLFHSGVTIYQFGGEGEGKAYLTHDYREQLWQAQTPTTWALQDLYRLWGAGWDPTSPFVPILYDVHPVAFLIKGQEISRFEPMAVDLDDVGHLVRRDGAPTAYVRVANYGDRLNELAVARLTTTISPGVNHLRALQRIAGANADLCAAIDQLLARLSSGTGDRAALANALDALAPGIATLGDRTAQWHLQMARGFLLGEGRQSAWNDPYTPRYIALTMPVYKALGVGGKVAGLLGQHAAAAAVLVLGVCLALAALGLRVRRVRRRAMRGAVRG
jgi:inosine-uridine nucleoside N-ribohydrolase